MHAECNVWNKSRDDSVNSIIMISETDYTQCIIVAEIVTTGLKGPG